MNRLARLLVIPYACCLACNKASAMDLGQESFGGQPLAIGAGPRALGMGGAFSAIADDATACTWNPAGLTQCELPELAMSAGAYRSSIHDDSSDARQALRAEHISTMLPFYLFGCQQVIGVAWQRQYDFTNRQAWHSEVATPFSSSIQDTGLDRSGSLASCGLCYAIELVPGWSIGTTINRWDDRLTGASHYRISSDSETVNDVFGVSSTYRSSTDSRIRVASSTSLVLGSWWQATADLTLAVVAKPAYHLDLDVDTATTTVDIQAGNPPVITSIIESRSSTLHHPPSLTFGAALRHADLHTVSLDATITRWRLYYVENEAGRYSPININIDPNEFSDLWTIRMGYEYIAILPGAVVVPRCGALLEYLPACTPAPASAQEQTRATRDRWLGLTAGFSVCQRQMTWDAAVQMRRGVNVGTNSYTAFDRTADVTVTEARIGVSVFF